MLQCVVLYCIVLQFCGSVLHYVAVCCIVLQYIDSVVHPSMLQTSCLNARSTAPDQTVLQCGAVCCSVVQCVADQSNRRESLCRAHPSASSVAGISPSQGSPTNSRTTSAAVPKVKLSYHGIYVEYLSDETMCKCASRNSRPRTAELLLLTPPK